MEWQETSPAICCMRALFWPAISWNISPKHSGTVSNRRNESCSTFRNGGRHPAIPVFASNSLIPGTSPPFEQTKETHMKSKTFPVRIILLLLTAFPLAAQVAPELPNPGSPSLSRQQQEQLGLQTMGEVYRQMPVLPESHPVSRYVQQLGRRL